MSNLETAEETLYEITFLTEGEDLSRVRKIFEKNHATVTGERPLVKIRLNHVIKKQNFGFMGIFYFKAEPTAIEPLTKEMSLDGGLMRFLVTRARIMTDEERAPRIIPGRPPFSPRPIRKPFPEPAALTNEALEKKIEEILK